jgi:hypothetical protein
MPHAMILNTDVLQYSKYYSIFQKLKFRKEKKIVLRRDNI